jgi:hypothetical protein
MYNIQKFVPQLFFEPHARIAQAVFPPAAHPAANFAGNERNAAPDAVRP